MSGQQHVEFHRKVQMRRHLLRRWGDLDGAAYVPFVGDGDLAALLYTDRPILAADIDSGRVDAARLAISQRVAERGFEDVAPFRVQVADCNEFPYADWGGAPYAIGDFDAYAEPYTAFRSFWQGTAPAGTADRVLLFFTDGQRQSMMRVGNRVGPDGRHFSAVDLETRQALFHRYFSKTILPWFTDYVARRGASSTVSGTFAAGCSTGAR